MLCQRCPRRKFCKSPCKALEKDLRRFESPQFEIPILDIEEQIEQNEPDLPPIESSEVDSMKIVELLACLTFNERSCIEKFYWGGKSQRQIAQELQLTQSGVSRLLQTALHKLRQSYSSPSTLYIGTLAS